MPAGRPSTYKPEYCEQVIELGRQGKSQVQISAAINVPRSTMLRWGEEHDEFRTALARAKELEQAWWETVGQSELSNSRFNAAVWAKNMAGRFRDEWGDRVVQEHAGMAALAPGVSEEDLDKRLHRLLAKAGIGHRITYSEVEKPDQEQS